MTEPRNSGAYLALATARANADPLPGPLGKAFGPSTVMVGNIAVRKPVAADWEIMRQLNSPIYRLLLDLRQDPDAEITEPTASEAYEICWQFTHTPAECRSLLAKGREAFTQVALEEIGDKIESQIVTLIQTVILNKIGEANQTAIQYAADLKEKGEVNFFPDSGATRTTVSAGGSNTSPDSPEPIPAGATSS